MPICLRPKRAHTGSLHPEEWFATANPLRRKALAVLIAVCRKDPVAPLDRATWEEAVHIAYDHGLMSLLALQLLSLAPADAVALAAQVREQVVSRTQRNLMLIAETLRLNTAFKQAGLRAIFFKGCLLSQIAHGESHRRQVGDLDVLVEPQDRDAAVAVLGRSGYHLDAAWTDAIRDGHFEYDCECSLYDGPRRMCVDLHWHFTPRNCFIPLDLGALFERAQQARFHGQDVPTFSPEDQILVLCVHGAKHYWKKLEWTYTIATFIRSNPALDWGLILQRATDAGLHHILGSGILLATEIFCAPVPDYVRAAVMADRAAWELSVTGMRWVAAAPAHSPSAFEIRRFQSLSRASFLAKARYWSSVILTPTERDYNLPLPRVLHPLYCLLRLWRLCGEIFRAGEAERDAPGAAPQNSSVSPSQNKDARAQPSSAISAHGTE